MLLLNKANLKVAAFASKKESRYTLQAIHVSDKGTCATDGHRLVRVSLPSAKVGEYPSVPNFPKGNGVTSGLIPLSLVAKLDKNIPQEETIPVLNHVGVSFDEENVNTVTTDLETYSVLTHKKVTGNFPNVEAVIPTKPPMFEICVNADLLASLAKGAAEFTKEYPYRPLKLRFYGAREAIRLDCKRVEGQEWTGVLMPISFDSGEYSGEQPVKDSAQVDAEEDSAAAETSQSDR